MVRRTLLAHAVDVALFTPALAVAVAGKRSRELPPLPSIGVSAEEALPALVAWSGGAASVCALLAGMLAENILVETSENAMPEAVFDGRLKPALEALAEHFEGRSKAERSDLAERLEKAIKRYGYGRAEAWPTAATS